MIRPPFLDRGNRIGEILRLPGHDLTSRGQADQDVAPASKEPLRHQDREGCAHSAADDAGRSSGERELA